MKYYLLPFLGIGHIFLFAWLASLIYPWIGWPSFLILPLSVPLVFGPVSVFVAKGRCIRIADYIAVMKQPPGY